MACCHRRRALSSDRTGPATREPTGTLESERRLGSRRQVDYHIVDQTVDVLPVTPLAAVYDRPSEIPGSDGTHICAIHRQPFHRRFPLPVRVVENCHRSSQGASEIPEFLQVEDALGDVANVLDVHLHLVVPGSRTSEHRSQRFADEDGMPGVRA